MRIVIEPYDPAWPAAFDGERALIEPLLAQWLAAPIEHIGSTAVPGLAAKPIIDIMAPVRSLSDSVPAIDAAREAGYCHDPYRADVMHWLCKPGPAFRTHHLHLVPYRSALWNERLAFRDALRADARLAKRYAALKEALAAKWPDDREAYTDAKTSFIQEALGRRPRI